VLEDVGDVRTGLHICRGNWSQDESTLLRGSYQPLAAYLDQMNVQQLVLEYATERAGDVLRFDGKELGLGVANPRTETPETFDEIRESIDGALQLYPAERLFLNPDCGFGTFSNRPVNESNIAFQKVKGIVEVAKSFR